MKLPGQDLVETILADVKEMQVDLNGRLDTIAELLRELIEIQTTQTQQTHEFQMRLNGIDPDKI